MEEKKYVVYKHTSPSGKCYIGITCKKPERRWRNGNGYKGQMFYRAIKKYGWENIKHEIISEDLSHADANNMEQELIVKYKCRIPNGYNITKGGDGALGVPWNNNQRNAIIKWNNSSEFKKILYLRNKESSKKIYEDNIDGCFIQAYNSMTEASLKNNVTIQSLYAALKYNTLCCNKQWRDSYCESVLPYENRMLRKVAQIDLNSGEIVNTYSSITEAERVANTNNISNCCNNKNKSSGGYGWVFLEDVDNININQFKKNTTGRSVCQYNKNNDQINEFESMHEAERETGIGYRQIFKVCKGQRKTAGGYIWKYAE